MLTGEVLARAAAATPEKPAVVEGDRSLSFAALDGQANRFANALNAAGYGRGDTVAILSANHLEYPVFFFGAARSGCVGAHLSVRYTPDDMRYVLRKCAARAVFVHADLQPALAAVHDDLPELRDVVVFGGPAGPGGVTWEAFLGGAPDSPPPVALSETDSFSLTFTGGTTGFPKAVLVDHRARMTASRGAWACFELEPDDVLLQATPMFHVAGLCSWYLTGAIGGCTAVFLPHWSVEGFFDAVERRGVTAAFMVPTQVNAFVQHPGFDPARLQGLRYLNFGGAAMPVPLLQRLRELFPEMVLIEHYGQSETGAVCYRPSAMALDKPNSVGVPFPDVQLSIRDAAGAPVSDGQAGEVVVRGAVVMREYVGDPDQTAAAFTADGWVRTGDVGYLDEDGYLILVDRSKDVIIAGGENVYPTEIENALYKHPAVAECAVFGIPDERWGEVPAAHVVLAEGAEVEEAALIEFVAGRIARHKRPRLIRFVETLPKTAVGKIQKNLIRAPYWEGAARTG